MAIQVTEGEVQPALVYDKVFMQNLSVEQRPVTFDNVPPQYALRIEYRLYAVDEAGNRHYQDRVDSLVIGDALTVAVAKAQQGDESLLNAIKAIEQGLAILINDTQKLGSAKVV